MRRFIFLLVFLLSLSKINTGLADSNPSLTLFSNQKAAQRHCPNDEVVWLNTKTGIWHSQGGRWYGNTKSGAFVCEKEAARTGNRASLNG